MRRFAIIAGETSGDRLGADLMQGLKRSNTKVEFEGVGGEAMDAAGLSSRFPMSELSLMGIVEILPHIPRLLGRIDELAEYISRGNFDALISIDSPDFNFRLARKVKARRPDLPIIHYVAPSVWAWRAGRADRIAKYVDHVLCLLPFEPELMREAGMSADFVGHPAANKAVPSTMEIAQWRKENGEVLALFPGSRAGEIKRHLPVYRDLWARLVEENPALNLHIAALAPFEDEIARAFGDCNNITILSSPEFAPEEFEARKSALMSGARGALATSGTIALELAFANCPGVIGYQSSLLTRFLIKRLVRTKYASLPNIILERPLIPEFLFENFNAEAIYPCAQELLSDATLREAMQAGYEEMREIMRAPMNAAKSVASFLRGR